MTIGTDPEFFIRDKKTGKYMNAEPMFPGTKEEPHIMKSKAGLQTDNVAVEFASDVAENGKDFVSKLRATFHELFKMIPEGMVLDTAPSAMFENDQLQTPQANLFGCSPSYSAWELKENDQPDATNTNMRSIGGHIHVGAEIGSKNEFLLEPFGKVDTVKTMDVFHGIISVVLDNSEASVERRKLYGSAGEHRPTEYGVEYRTLSSFWLKSPNLVMLINSLTEDVLKLVREEKHEQVIDEIGADTVQAIINEGRVGEAQAVIDNILTYHLSVDSTHYLAECMENIEKYDFAKEWEINV